jgi:hypothetical protein
MPDPIIMGKPIIAITDLFLQPLSRRFRAQPVDTGFVHTIHSGAFHIGRASTSTNHDSQSAAQRHEHGGGDYDRQLRLSLPATENVFYASNEALGGTESARGFFFVCGGEPEETGVEKKECAC